MQHKNEIIIALIGFIGVAFTAVVSNYDKLFGEDISPYEHVNDVETQLRYYVDISGFRKGLEEMDRSVAERYKQKYQASETTINCMMDMRIQKEQLIELFVSVYKEHVTLQKMKDINRFYSTEAMKSFTSLSPIIARDLVVGINDLYQRMYIRNSALSGKLERGDQNSCK
jgi:predicted transport protein